VNQIAVLLVDDRPENLLALEATLGDLDVDLVRASSGEEALACARDREFCVVLLDVHMPGTDGFEVARRLRGEDRTRHLPIVLMTAGDTTRELMLQAYSGGAVDFIMKPFHAEIIRAKVSVFVELDRRARLLREATIREQALQHQVEARRRADQMRRESDQRFRVLAETAVDAIITIDEQSVVLYANPAVERIFGYTPTQLIGGSLTRLIPPGMRAQHSAGLARYLATGERTLPWRDLKLNGLKATGDEVPLEITFTEYTEGGRRYFTATMRDITERRRGEDERARLLAVARAAAVHAEAASRAKSEFLATMSHELRTPINAIFGYTELLELEIAGPINTAQRNDLGRIMASGRHLLGVVDDLLDIAKLESGHMEFVRVEGDAGRVVADAVALVRP
jgi:PAS domain S-box-containing protein